MSVASEISRLRTAKADLKTSIEAKGVTVPSSAKLDNYANYVDAISVGATLQAKTNITPTEFSQTITADNGYDGLSSVQINAISSSYVGSGITQRTSSDLTESGSLVTVPSGYYASDATKLVTSGTYGSGSVSREKNATNLTYSVTYPNFTAGYLTYAPSSTINLLLENRTVTPSTSQQTITPTNMGTYLDYVTVEAMPSGTAGTPTATKGNVSNHSVSVTPSVTNTTGYITGSTINGTAVSVSASELVSGTYTVTVGGTFDITNYASLGVPGMSLPTSAVSSTSYELMRANFLPSESTRYIEIPKGFHDVDQYYMLDPVSSTYVGSGITRRSSSDLTASNLTVTAPSGYYASNATKTLTDANLLATNIKKDVSIFGVTGTYEGSGSGGGSVVAIDSKSTTPSSAGSSISFTGLSGEPTSFIVYTTSDLATGASPFKVAAVVFDGTDLHGQTITNTSNAQVTYDGSSFSKTYSNGTLTITSTGAYFQAQQYWLDYSYGGSSSDIHTADVQVGSGATSITFSNLEGEPIYISLIFKSNFSTSNGYQRTIWVADKYDGEGPFGMAMDSSAHYTYANYRNSGSGTTVTINSSSANAGGYFHQPGYYQLTYVTESDGSPYQKKTVTPTTSQQIITADTGYEALSQVTVNAIPSSYVQPTTTVGSTTYRASTSSQTINAGTYHSAAATIAAVTQTNLTAANIKSGTTITISNGQSNLWSVTGTYTGGGSDGSFSVATTTWTNSTNTTTSHEFTGLSGTPKFAVLRCTSQLTRSSSNTYYYIADIVWNGTSAYGNYHLRSNGSFNNVASNATTKFTVTTGTNSITFTSGGTRGGAPGSFYNGTYELTYVY